MKFTETHEWIEVKDGIGLVGVTVYAQKELGDIVYVELPMADKSIKKGEEAAVLESTKAAADVYAPVSGKIISANTALKDTPELVNSSPENKGWLFKIALTDPTELDALLDAEVYKSRFL